MNFVSGFFLYHSEEYITFWLIVTLMEEYELRNIYLPGYDDIEDGLPGLSYHANKLNEILKLKLNEAYFIFKNNNIQLKIIIVEWIFSLFSSIIPLEVQINFYEGFFAEGWDFFYKMCLSIMIYYNISSRDFHDSDDVYLALKMEKDNENIGKNSSVWIEIINNAYKLDINN